MSKRRSELISQAFEAAVEVLGERSKRLLIEDLKYHNVELNDPELNLQKLMNALKEILHEEAAEMLIERMLIKLDEIESRGNRKYSTLVVLLRIPSKRLTIEHRLC